MVRAVVRQALQNQPAMTSTVLGNNRCYGLVKLKLKVLVGGCDRHRFSVWSLAIL